MNKFTLIVLTALIALIPARAHGSDHADPLNLKWLESGISDLFVFPAGENLIVILGVRPGLSQSPPLDLEPFTYRVHFDLHSPVSFDDEVARARYGGQVGRPEGIAEDATISIRLNNDAKLGDLATDGLSGAERIELWTGIRDDPFIHPNFFGTNVVAMVLRIPLTAFPIGQRTWLVWGTSHEGNRQIDHVGRSNRTMLPRMNLLNTIHPSRHLAAITEAHTNPKLMQDIARSKIQPLFGLRAYDFVPDVMIYTSDYPAGFPNGRLPSDDVAKLTCEYGDCLLYQLSFNTTGPRPTGNDKAFLERFPYLAEPWPDQAPKPGASLTTKSRITLAAIALAALLIIILENWLVARWYCRRRAARGD